MKTIIRLAVLALAGTSALALAGNALATQKLSVRQTTTSLTIKVSQAQSDAQPARISIYVPTGYSINASAGRCRPANIKMKCWRALPLRCWMLSSPRIGVFPSGAKPAEKCL